MAPLYELLMKLPIQTYIAASLFAINVIVAMVIIATVRRRAEEAEEEEELAAQRALSEGERGWGAPYFVPYPAYVLPVAPPAPAQGTAETDTAQNAPYAEYATPVREAETAAEAFAQPVISAPAYVDRPSAQAEEQGFYHGDDEFLRTLSETEYVEFVDAFIAKRPIGELPYYKVGARNSGFFRRFFLYLHKTRSCVSEGLMWKIYQYAVKRQLITDENE